MRKHQTPERQADGLPPQTQIRTDDAAARLLTLQRTAGNRAVAQLVTGRPAAVQIQRVGLLSKQETAPNGASEGYRKALTLIDAFRVQYDKLKTDAVTGSVLEWLDTLAPLASGRLANAKAEDERALLQRLLPPLAKVREELTQLTNAYRVPGGQHNVGRRKPLVLETRLNHAAQAHAVHLAQAGSRLSHTGEEGSSAELRIKVGEGYLEPTTSENIAHGQKTPVEAITSWINSPGHELDLVRAEVGEVGFGYAVSATGDQFWVQTFGEPRR